MNVSTVLVMVSQVCIYKAVLFNRKENCKICVRHHNRSNRSTRKNGQMDLGKCGQICMSNMADNEMHISFLVCIQTYIHYCFSVNVGLCIRYRYIHVFSIVIFQ